MKQVKIFGITMVILLLCMAGKVCESRAANVTGVLGEEGKVFEGKRKQLPAFHSIEADLTDLDLKIVSTKKQSSSLSYFIYCKNNENPFTYAVNNGVLYLKETGIKNLSKEELKQKIGKKWWKYSPKVTLYIPANTVINNSRINMKKGNLAIGKKTRYKDMNVQVKGGDIALSSLRISGTAKINTAKGNIAAATLVVPGSLQITTKDGDIAWVGFKVSGNTRINSTNGNIVVRTDKKNFNSLTVTGRTKYGSMLVIGNGKKKASGDGRYYKKNGSGKGKLNITTKYGNILLK